MSFWKNLFNSPPDVVSQKKLIEIAEKTILEDEHGPVGPNEIYNEETKSIIRRTQWGNNIVVNVNSNTGGSVLTNTQWGANMVFNVTLKDASDEEMAKFIAKAAEAFKNLINDSCSESGNHQGPKHTVPLEMLKEYEFTGQLNILESKLQLSIPEKKEK